MIEQKDCLFVLRNNGDQILERQSATEKISDEELGNLLAALGNNEAKTLTFLTLSDGNIATASGLASKISRFQGSLPAWNPHKSTLFTYCESSLTPIGLVAKEFIDDKANAWGYQITDYGRRLGIPLAGLLLDFSREHKEALYHFFGRTQSVTQESELDVGSKTIQVKKRSPRERLRIFWDLLTSKLPVREVDLGSHLKESSAIGHHLDDLDRFGIIQYDSIEPNKPIAYFQVLSERPEITPSAVGTHKVLTNVIYDVLKTSPEQWFTREQVRDAIIKEFPDKVTLDQNDFLANISRILTHLVREGYLKRQKFGNFTQSEVSLSEPQRTVLCQLITMLDRFQQGDLELLAFGRQKAAEITNNPGIVSKLMLKAKEASPEANKTPVAITQGSILAIIRNNPGINTRTVQKKLEEFDQKLTLLRVSKIIASLRKANLVERIGEKGFHWRLKEDS